jgi:hypothetical protein
MTYSFSEGRPLMQTTPNTALLINNTKQFFEGTSTTWHLSGAATGGSFEILQYYDYSANVEGQLWINDGGVVKIYYISGATLIPSVFSLDNSVYNLLKISVDSNNWVCVHKSNTFIFPYFWYIDASNLTGFYQVVSTVGLINTEVFPATIGLYQIDSVVYKPYGQLYTIGAAYPVASGAAEIQMFSITGGWQGRINNGFVAYKAIAHNTFDGLIYAIDANGRLKSYDGSALPLSDVQLSFTPALSGVEMVYDSYFDKLVVLNGVGGNIYLVNPYSGDVIQPIGTPISGYAFHGIATDNQGRIYVNTLDITASLGRILSISFINGDQIDINGIFAGGETTLIWTDGQNCLTQEEVEGMFEQIKSWLGVSVCGDQDFSMPDSPYSLQNRLLTTSTGLFITTALGQYIAI